IKGYVSDHENRPISAVSIQELKTQTGTSTNRSGYFEIKVSDTDTAIIRLSHVSYQTCIDTVVIDNNISTLSIFLEEITSVLDNIEVLDKSNVQGINTALLNAQSFKDITVPFSDFSGVIKSLPGVVSNNELSSTYSVRGGSFNENMIYVNGIPVYRPFLISNGQQEGLSFINSDFVRSVSFSAGGWNASKADRLSSVLDVFYKNTDKLEINVDAGLLGGKLFLGGRNKSGKLQYMLGVRKKTSKYLFKGLEVKGEYFPNFIDLQGYVKLNLKNSSISFLTNFANNDYTVQPTSRQSDFGTLNNTYRIFIAFEGSENMEYKTLQNAVKWEWDLTKKWNLNLIASLVSSREY
ncbi:MAG: TonB-dependent receptor, partial [Cyclobacteriaceae bacterium]|nr:TonB-dependent receptor [Cyclobacteriaceae bacterium]